LQTAFANHPSAGSVHRLMVLQSKVVVLNVQVKMLYKQYQVRVKKLNENKPLMKCRKGSSYIKSQGFHDRGDRL
jgi:hypothetical protein